MPRLVHNCPICLKPAEIKSEFKFSSGLINYIYKCGHIELRDSIIPDNSADYADPSFKALNGSPKMAYDFQVDGVRFAENTNLNCLIADAMGLGKTIQALLILKRNKKLMCPCLIIVKQTVLFQWARELKEWASAHPMGVFPILNRNTIIPGFGAYLISMDLLARKGVLELLKPLGLKSIIVDEVHNFKNPDTARARALVRLVQENLIEYKIALSGSPIKNRADEYFTILNLLAPHEFRSLERFRRRWLMQNEKGAYTRVHPYYLEEFKKLISKWVIRREAHEVLTNLPPLTRDYQFVEIEDQDLKNSYNKTLDLFSNFLNNTAKVTSNDLLGWLAKLRAITGQAKCQNAIDWANDFLDSTDDSLSIGIEHHSVRDTLYYVFRAAGYDPLKLSGEDDMYTKDRIVKAFTSGQNRLLVVNMKAGGEGLNLQTCANALILERAWNSVNESQFEGRFHRDGQQKGVMITYMIAKGTIDEWFHEMIEQKRRIFNETISSNWALTADDNSLRELANQAIANPLK